MRMTMARWKTAECMGNGENDGAVGMIKKYAGGASGAMEAMFGVDWSMMMRMPDDVCRVGDMCKDDLLEQSHSDRLTNTHWEVQKCLKIPKK